MNKLSPGTLLLGIFAVLFGLVGAYAVKQHLQQEKPEPVETAAVVRLAVPMAAADLAEGRTITAGDIVLVRMTREEIEKRGLPQGFMANSNQIVGRTLREPVKRNETFVTTTFYPEGVGPSVASRLKPGYRAVTISLESNTASAGLVTPGAIVDVIFRLTANEREALPETTVTLLEMVEVLAMDQETFAGARARSGAASRGATVSLAVTPEQAAALKVTEGHGSLALALRSPDDDGIASSSTPATLASVLGLPAPEKPFATEVYRRGRLSTTLFDSGQRGITVHELPIPAMTGSQPTPVRAKTTQSTEDAGSPTRAKTTSTRTIGTRTLASAASWKQPAACCGKK